MVSSKKYDALETSGGLSVELCEAITIVVAVYGGKITLPAVGLTQDVYKALVAIFEPAGIRAHWELLYHRIDGSTLGGATLDTLHFERTEGR